MRIENLLARPKPKASGLSSTVVQPRVKILVADSSSATAQAISDYTRRSARHVQVTQVTDVQALSERLASETFEVAFVDLRMPGLDTVARQRTENSSGFMVGMADKPTARDREILRSLMAFDLVAKPLDPRSLDAIFKIQERAGVPIRILIVDSSPTVRKVVTKVLARSVFKTSPEEAGTGGSAVSMCRDQPFDVVLLELNMSGMDGAQTLRQIKRAVPNLKVILTSTESREAVMQRIDVSLMDDFLRKPFYPDAMDRRLRALCDLPEIIEI